MTSQNDGGLGNVMAAMDRLKAEARAAVMESLTKGATHIAVTARTFAPVDSGDLRDSIEVTPPGAHTPPYSQPGGSRVAGENEVIITAGNEDVRYAHLVEYGTANAEAQPFFWPAYRLNAAKIKRNAASLFKRRLKKAWKP
ncbi:HK97-gp10 family putative phage morphogenesis protein [Rhizobium halophilum]|uniref:HK97-gp10 family putative phage morphogenesis protein n=1 Tax=Rhizobium halophilum TaxID=2846852 RepID=UPI001EFD4895|nr:HK97-gp10 family putative phage morphogenesis protein [Rhizobium halophilum]MCF6370976.1 HK97 gp10 family phage protein [Rhizobium halophilum]